jgi:hypothetical protein
MMIRPPLRTLALAILLLLIGFAIGRAQTPMPDFELVVSAPGGETIVECVRGCGLQWWERGPNPNSVPAGKFTYACNAVRCSSGRIAGWLQRP